MKEGWNGDFEMIKIGLSISNVNPGIITKGTLSFKLDVPKLALLQYEIDTICIVVKRLLLVFLLFSFFCFYFPPLICETNGY